MSNRLRTYVHDEQVRLAMWEKWLSTRPAVVQEMANKYPIGTRFNIHGLVMHVIAYGEDGGLSVTETDPEEDYEKAVAGRVPICPCCVSSLDHLKIIDG
jgi:hypothetical protein